MQRPLRGSRISSFYPVKSLPQLSSLDSAFQLQEYISLLIRLDVHDVERIIEVPGKPGKEENSGSDSKDSRPTEENKPEDGSVPAEDKEVKEKDMTVDEYCWIYEHLRRLAQDLTHPLITMLQQECNRSTCPEMKAGEWLYLCVAHGNDGAMEQCCAIDYILHTIDSATALLNSPRAFPSRISIPPTSHRHFSSLARRLGRVFAHAYYHHREVFEQAEAESSLYKRFLRLTERFGLVPREFLVIPGSGEPNTYETRGEPTTDVEGHGGKVILGKEMPYEQAYPTWSRVPPQTLSDHQHEDSSNQSHHQHQEAATSLDSPLDPDAGFSPGGGPPGLSATSSSGTGSDSPSPPGSGFAGRTGRNRTDTMVLHPKEDKEPPVTSTTTTTSDDENYKSTSQSEPESVQASTSSSSPPEAETELPEEATEPSEQAQVEVKEVKDEEEEVAVTKQEEPEPTSAPSESASSSTSTAVGAPPSDTSDTHPSSSEVEVEVKGDEDEQNKSEAVDNGVTPSSSTALHSSSASEEQKQVETDIASSNVPVEAKLTEVEIEGVKPDSEGETEDEGTTSHGKASEEAGEQVEAEPVTEVTEPTEAAVEKPEAGETVASTKTIEEEPKGRAEPEAESLPEVEKVETQASEESSQTVANVDTNPLPAAPVKSDEGESGNTTTTAKNEPEISTTTDAAAQLDEDKSEVKEEDGKGKEEESS